MQNIIIFLIVSACVLYLGRRYYKNLRNSGGSCGCGCSCSDCGPEISTTCDHQKKSDLLK